ncbi:hypothetical protein D910_10443 [Dendroctonus ponderosae]|uniref:Reverse transcriptase domain-containing protein n=1 Tax=Dendroctonus ponderosae TaxID=77166 RepID=U4UGN9_DENPD|nr:hypothetical protein D910_10443 [Dendroctonus ponderosae]
MYPLTEQEIARCIDSVPGLDDSFKKSLIVPVYKSGSKNLIENYRPISLINNFAKLLEKCLKQYGLRGQGIEIFQSYLSYREQYVKVNNQISSSLNIKMGILQGTILGPILFISYIKCLLGLNMNGKIVSYADDTALIFSGVSWDEVKKKAMDGMDVVKQWLDSHKLSLNVAKTHFIPFSITKANRPHFSLVSQINPDLKIKAVSKPFKSFDTVLQRHLQKMSNSCDSFEWKFRCPAV